VKSKLSIKAKLIILLLCSIIAVAIVISINSILSLQQVSKENVENFKKEAYEKKEEELKNYVSLAMKTVDSFYQRTSKEKVKLEVEAYLKEQSDFLFSIIQGEYEQHKNSMPTAQLKQRIIDIVNSTRYGSEGYFWVNDTDAVIVIHPIKRQLDGKNLYDFKDKNGKQIFKEFAEVASKNGDGYVDYVWPKPGFEKPQDKVSYVRLFEPFNWVIGNGEYVDNVTERLQEEALKTIGEMRYGVDGYFWINDSHPNMIMHPIKPSLDGKDLSQVKDPNGKFLFNEFVKATQKSAAGGMVDYMWPKPGKEEPQLKLSYVQKFGPWDWIIGTGEYVDNIEDEVALMEAKTSDGVNDIIISISIFSLISVIVLYFIVSFLLKKAVVSPLEELNQAVINLSKNKGTSGDVIKKVNDDEIGKIIDSFNGYLQMLRDNAKQDEVVIKEVEEVISKVNNGFYAYRVHATSNNPLVEELRTSINSMIEKAYSNLAQINANLVEYVKSNYNIQNDAKDDTSGGIIASIAKSSVLVGKNISEFLCMINHAGDKLNDDTKVLSTSANALSTSANEQAASLEETAAAIEQITSNIKQNTQNVSKMSELANDLNQSATNGQGLAQKTNQAMEDIDEQVKSINDAITVIDQIAFQTNILSLNAAVEAATAGEAGKGFAVVAQEVRNLASRSAEAAKEIKAIVENATNKANEGKLIADDMIKGYGTLNDKVVQTIDLISDVAAASKEQESGIVQINDTVAVLDRATQVNASSASEINRLSNEVRHMAEDLLNISSKASYDSSLKNQTCDVDMVFTIAKLKNDHIVFKNTNFGKLGASGVSSWKVTDHHSCNLGKWIDAQEAQGKAFTKTSNWTELKEAHKAVHGNVQRYVDDNAQKQDGHHLHSVSKDLEQSMCKVFDLLDKIKIDNCQIQSSPKPAPAIEKKPESKTQQNKTTSAPSEKQKADSKPKETYKKQQPTQTSKKSHDDDEWESF
jgi:methyl-accepting chemotaxis protein